MKKTSVAVRRGISGVLLGALVCTVGATMYFWEQPRQAPASSFVLLDGSKRQTSDFRGHVTLVNFWATTCSVCVDEMPELVATFQKYHAIGFETVAVSMQYDPPIAVLRFAQSRKLPFGVAIDNSGAIAKAWGGVQATPTSFLLDQRGRVVKRYVGRPDFAELHREIEALLKAG